MTKLDTATREYVEKLNKDPYGADEGGEDSSGDDSAFDQGIDTWAEVPENDPTTPDDLTLAGFEGERQTSFSNEDREYVTGDAKMSQQEMFNQSVNTQSGMTKALRSVGRGIVGGTIGFGENAGALLHLINEDLGKTIMDFSHELKQDVLDESMKVYQQSLPEDAGYWDHFARWDVLESGVSSIVQFGVGGMGIGVGFKMAGKALLKAGMSNAMINGAGGAANVLTKSGKFVSNGKNFTMFGKSINSTAVQAGMTSNLLEGRIMGRELERELTTMYNPLLLDPNVSIAEKKVVLDDIANAGDNMVLFNTTLAAVDISGFSNLLKYSKGGLLKPGLKGWAKTQVKMAPKEGAEEVIQNIIQKEAGYEQIRDIDEDRKAKDQKSIDEMFKASNIDGSGTISGIESAEASYKKYITGHNKSFTDRLWQYGTSKQAFTEGMTGLLSGPGQWMATGSISAYANRKATAEAYEAQQTYKEDVMGSLEGLTNITVNDANELEDIVDEAKEVYGEDSDQEVAITKFAVEKLVSDAVANGFEEVLLDQMNQLDKEQTADGRTSDEEVETRKVIKDAILEYTNMYKDISMYSGSDELAVLMFNRSKTEVVKRLLANSNNENNTEDMIGESIVLDAELKALQEKNKDLSTEEQGEAEKAVKRRILFDKLDEKTDFYDKGTVREARLINIAEKEIAGIELTSLEERIKAKNADLVRMKIQELQHSVITNPDMVDMSSMSSMDAYQRGLDQQMKFIKSAIGQKAFADKERQLALHSQDLSKISAIKSTQALDSKLKVLQTELEESEDKVNSARVSELIKQAENTRKKLLKAEDKRKNNTKVSGLNVVNDSSDTESTINETTETTQTEDGPNEVNVQDITMTDVMESYGMDEEFAGIIDDLQNEGMDYENTAEGQVQAKQAYLKYQAGLNAIGDVNQIVLQIDNAFGNAGMSVMADEMSSPLNISNEERAKAVASISELMNATLKLSNGKTMPSFKTYMSFMGDLGVNTEQYFDILKTMYEATVGVSITDTFDSLGTTKPHQKDSSDNFNTPEVVTEDLYSVLNFSLTGTAIAWEMNEDGTASIADFNIYKKGTAINISVDKMYSGVVKVDTNESLPWEVLKEHFKTHKTYEHVSALGDVTTFTYMDLVPMKIVDKNSKIIGRVHSTQWATNAYRQTEDKKSADMVLDVIKNIRENVIASPNKAVDTTITGRAIATTETSVIGTALNRHSEAVPTKESIDLSMGLELTVKKHSPTGTNLYFNVGTDKTIKGYPGLYEGTVMVLVPIEDAKEDGKPVFYAEPLRMHRLSTEEGKVVFDTMKLILGQSVADSHVKDAIESMYPNGVTAANVKNLLHSYINTDTNLNELQKTLTAKFNVVAEGDFVTIRVKQSSKDITVKVNTKTGALENTSKASMENFLAVLDHVNQPFEKEEDNLLPYFHVDAVRLQRKGKPNKLKTIVPIKDAKGDTVYEFVTYNNYDEAILDHSSTTLKRPSPISDGKVSFVTNTIVQFDPAMAAESKVGKKERQAAEKEQQEDAKRIAARTAAEQKIKNLKAEIEMLQEDERLALDRMTAQVTGDFTNSGANVLTETQQEAFQGAIGIVLEVLHTHGNIAELQKFLETITDKEVAAFFTQKVTDELRGELDLTVAQLFEVYRQVALEYNKVDKESTDRKKEIANKRRSLTATIKKFNRLSVVSNMIGPRAVVIDEVNALDLFGKTKKTIKSAITSAEAEGRILTDEEVLNTELFEKAKRKAKVKADAKAKTEAVKKAKEDRKKQDAIDKKSNISEEDKLKQELEAQAKLAEEVAEVKDVVPEDVEIAIVEDVLGQEEGVDMDVEAYSVTTSQKAFGTFPTLPMMISSLRGGEKRLLMFSKAMSLVTFNDQDISVDRLVTNALANFQLKSTRPDGSYRFNSTETSQIAKSLTSKILFTVATSVHEDINKDSFTEAAMDMQSDLIILARALKEFIDANKHTLGKSTEVMAANQMRASIAYLFENTYLLNNIINIGVKNAFVDLNISLSTINEENEVDQVSIDRAGSLERVVFTDDFMLTQKPADGLSARVRAKTKLFKAYTVNPHNQEEMIPKRDILNNVMYEEDAFEDLLNSTKNLYGYELDEKLEEFKRILAHAIQIGNPTKLFYADVVEMLEGTGVLALSERELAQLNTVLNKTEVVMTQINVNGNKFNEAVNNFSSSFMNFMLTLGDSLEQIVERDPHVRNAIRREIDRKVVYDANIASINKLGTDKEKVTAFSNASVMNLVAILRGYGSLTAKGKDYTHHINLIRPILTKRITNTFRLLNIALEPADIGLMLDLATLGTKVDVVTYSGDVTEDKQAFDAVLKNTFKDTSTYLSSTEDKSKRYISSYFKTMMNYIMNKVGIEVTTSSFRVGTKVISSFSNPSLITKFFSRVTQKRFFEENKKDVYRGRSRLLHLMDTHRGKASEDQSGESTVSSVVNSIMRNTKYQSLKSTWESSEQTSDSYKEQLNFSLGTYMSSNGYTKDQNYLDLEDRIGDITHKVQVRKGKFNSIAFSDKFRVFSMSGLDFNAAEVHTTEDGDTVALNMDHARYLVDSILAPEVARYLAFRNQKTPINVKGFDPSTFFSIPALNRNPNFKAALDNYANNTGGNIQSLFDIGVEHIGEMAVEALMPQMQRQMQGTIDQMVKGGILQEKNGVYILSKKYSDVEEYAYLKKPFKAGVVSTEITEDGFNLEAAKISDEIGAETLLEEYDLVAELNEDEPGAGDKDFYSIAEQFFTKEVLGDVNVFSASDFATLLATKYGFDITADTVKLTTVNPDILNITTKDFMLGTAKQAEIDAEKGTIEDTKSNVANTKKKGKQVTTRKTSGAVDIYRLQAFALNYEFGYTFHNANMGQLVYGDPAASSKGDFNTTIDNLGKRAAKNIAPGKHSAKGLTVYIGYRSMKENSPFYDGVQVPHTSTNVDRTDAQGYLTPKASYADKVAEGILTTAEVELAIAHYDGGEQITDLDLLHRIAINPIKPVYTGNRRVYAENGEYIDLGFYNKDSEIRLSKDLVGDSGPLAGLNDIMLQVEKQFAEDPAYDGVDVTVRAVPDSATKMGTVAWDNLLDLTTDEQGNFTEIAKGEDGKYLISDKNYSILDNDGLFTQLDIEHKGKNEITASGQMEDLFQNSINPEGSYLIDGVATSGEDLISEWESLIHEKLELGYGELSKYFKGDKKGTADKSATYKNINELMEAVDYSDANMSRLLKFAMDNHATTMDKQVNPLAKAWLDVDEKGYFKHSLALSPHIQQYLDAIRSLIDTNTIKNKRKGASFVLMSDFGIDLNNLKGSKVTLLDNFVPHKSGRLRPMMPGKDGNRGTPAQVIISWDMQADNISKADNPHLDINKYIVIQPDGTQLLNTATLPKEMFEAIGFRTPNQDYNSQAWVQVVGFMPKGMTDTIIAPMEFIDLMGSDFDVDKLYAYLQNTLQMEDGTIKVLNEKNLEELELDGEYKYQLKRIENDMMNIITAVLSDDDIIRDEIITSLSEDVITEAGDRIQEIKGLAQDDHLPYSAYFNMEKTINSLEAKDSVAITALLTRLYAQYRDRGLKLYSKTEDKKTKEVTMSTITAQLGEVEFTKWGESKKPKFLKPDGSKPVHEFHNIKNSISAFLSASVDNENLQVLFKLAIGPNTFDIMTGLTLLGFRADTTVAMLNNKAVLVSQLEADKMLKVRNSSLSAVGEEAIASVEGASFDIESVSVEKDGKQLINEDALAEKLYELMEVMEGIDFSAKALKLTPIQKEAVIQSLALRDFVRTTEKSFKHTTGPLRWTINSDSKGTERLLPSLGRNINSLKLAGFEEAVKIMESIPKAKGNYNIAKMFQKYAERMLASKSGNIVKLTVNKAAELGVEFDSMYDVLRVIKGRAFRHMEPSEFSLKQRIQYLRQSDNPDIKRLLRTNVFLSRIYTKGKGIAFRNSGIQDPADISYDLVGLASMGEVGGIDMGVLYRDLVGYGIVNDRRIAFPQSYSSFIHPAEVSKALDSKLASLEDLKPEEVIAVSIFTSDAKMKTIPQEASAPPGAKFYTTTTVVDGIEVLGLAYPGGIMTAKGVKNFYSGSRTSIDKIFETKTTKLGEPKVETIAYEEVKEADLNNTLERALSHLKDVPLKMFFKGYLKGEVELFKSRTGVGSMTTLSENGIVRKVIKINSEIPHQAPSEFTNTFVHELTHGLLSSAVRNWKEGVKNSAVSGISDEISRVFTSLDKARGDVLNTIQVVNLYERSGTAAEKKAFLDSHGFKMSVSEFEGEILPSLDGAYPGRYSTSVATTNVLTSLISNIVDSEGYPIFGGTTSADALTADEVLSMIDAGKVYTTKLGNTDYLTVKDDNGVAHRGYEVSANFLGLLKIVSSRPANYSMLNLQRASMSEFDVDELADVNKPLNSLTAFMYGLTSLNEFTASAYAYGGSNTLGYSYKELAPSVYVSASDTLPTGLGAMLAKMFKMISDLVKLMFSQNSNTLMKDVTYASALLSPSRMVSTMGTKNSMEYSKMANEIKKSCK